MTKESFITQMESLISLPAIKQFLVYIIGGISSVALDLLVVFSLLRLEATDITAITIGFVAGMGLNYMFHARITFRAQSSIKTLIRYLISVAINYSLTVFIVIVGRQLIDLETIICKMISLPFVAINGFLLYRFWIFRTFKKI